MRFSFSFFDWTFVMSRFLFVAVAVFASLFCRTSFSQSITLDPFCALQASQVYSECRQSGGGFFGCLVQSGSDYWTCSGSSLTSFRGRRRSPGRLRMAILGRRVNRRARLGSLFSRLR